MSVSRHHADWLSLVEFSGPFVSLPVLLRVFPQGLEPRDPAQAKALRAAYDEWQDNPTGSGVQRAWVLHVLCAVLGYPQEQIVEGQRLPAGLEANMPEMGESLRPDFAVVGPGGSDFAGQVQLLISSYPAEQALDKPVIGKHWKASPATRMTELLHGANVPLGLVNNGEHWMLVYAPRGETTGYASWYGALWLDEPITLRAFHSLLGVRRFFGVAADSTLLALLKDSANDQQEVTDQLGYQVREAVEVLVQSFDALDKESNRTILKEVDETVLYEAALTVMMRLVFLFSAEERDLLHLGKPLYDDNYAVSTLREQLQDAADRYGEEVLERRYDAWARLLATFRAVHCGIQHQDLLMQAYGGSLFDPDRYSFLEGRSASSAWRSTAAEPLAVNNRVVLHLLNSLQRLRTKVGISGTAETRRVSFRALGVEQIGHVYEGLLGHTAVRAKEPVLGIKGTRSKEPEIPLATLESLLAQGEDKLIEYLKDETGRSVSALRHTLNQDNRSEVHKLLIACDQNKDLLARLRPFTGLIREDSFERPLVVLPDSVYVTAATTRRSTGTHYTPPSLTEPIVQYTLEPLVYEGPAEGWSREEWKLKPPKAILDLKVCDMAMGSGAFLVQACRYLAERLVEAWENEEKQHPGEVLITPDGKFSQGKPSERVVPLDASERIAIARRTVADRCLYGVDINPMAVEMAKLSLWLVTVDRHRPFTFLDHAFKCGDSLLGITSLEQLENFSLRAGGGKQQTFATLNLQRHIDDAKSKREALEAMPSDTPEQITTKTGLYVEAEEAVVRLNAVADVLLALELKGLNGRAYETEREVLAERMMAYWTKGLEEILAYAGHCIGARPSFHWPTEFPEVFVNGGFSAFIGNPPYMGGSKLETRFGTEWRGFLVSHIANGITGVRGGADLCTYFLLKAYVLLSSPGTIGLIATNSLSQGDSRIVGLEQLLRKDAVILRAIADKPWPGSATVHYSAVWIRSADWNSVRILDDRPVAFISSFLAEDKDEQKEPLLLRANIAKAFEGTKVLGIGFVISPQEAAALVAQRESNAEVLQLYLTGEDLNSQPDLSPTRWVINFRDWDLSRAETYAECLAIVRERVKPGRDAMIGRNPMSTQRGNNWWKFAGEAKNLYRAIAMQTRAITLSRITNYLSFAFVPTNWVFSDRLTVFAFSDYFEWAALQSSFHYFWAWRYSTTNLSLLSYSPSQAFNTFPFPRPDEASAVSVRRAAADYYSARSEFMVESNLGLTATYNRFHLRSDTTSEMAILRSHHLNMDAAVAAAYGWEDLDLGHDFHETKQGIRFTISEVARREVLDRLLALNHRRHAEEEAELAARPVAARAKPGRKKKDAGDQVTMDL